MELIIMMKANKFYFMLKKFKIDQDTLAGERKKHGVVLKSLT